MQPASSSDSASPPNTSNSRSSTTPSASSTNAGTLLELGPPSPPQAGNVANNPFDYEQKYAPDEEFEEMSAKARVFRVYVDESTKYDREMVNGWREGLDMLLVFAALFSAVVTTFVTQNSQTLREDKSDVANSLMSEMIGVQRAILRALVYKPDTVEVVPSATTSFHRKSSDSWVNGLWFTSLGLSLAPTLLAILAKQWIHQYLSVHAGSPRNQCRVRHLRYTALHKWHVPLIIDFLPVLMHAALGLFFIGLIIYLSSLSAAMAVIMAVIATSAFGMYFICSVLPIFYPDCAYKTPLSIYSYSLYSVPASFPDIELNLVARLGHILDASALGWLFNVTSNLSIQSIVLQAFSSLPLRSVEIIAKGGREGIASVPKAVKDHFHFDQAVGRFERLQRAALRFANQDPEISLSTACKESSSYSAFRDSTSARQLISACLTYTPRPKVRFDAVYWGKIFSTAMLHGPHWLDIDHDRPSRVWSELLRCAIFPVHVCDRCDCEKTRRPLLTYPLPPMPSLSIDTEEASASDGTYPGIQSALINHMLPSFLNWLLKVGFPDAARSETQHTENLPDDMFLQLIMLQTPSFQKTSSLYKTWVADNPTLVRFMKSCKPSPFRELLDVVHGYVLIEDLSLRHPEIRNAALIALQNVMCSDTFGSGTIMTTEDEALIVESVFGGLNWRFHDSGYRDHDFSWLTSEIMEKSLRIAFEAQEGATLISHILSYLLCSSTLLPALELVYTGLLKRGWLQGLTTNLKHGWWYPNASLPENTQPLLLWTIHHTAFSVAAYIDGLGVLSSRSSDLYREILNNLVEPAHLSTVCKTLLLSEVGTQSKLWKLAQFLEIDQWERARDDFVSFSVSPQARAMYREHLFIPSVGLAGQKTTNVPPSLLGTVAEAFASDIARRHYAPPSDTSYGFDYKYVSLSYWFAQKRYGKEEEDSETKSTLSSVS